MHLYFLSREERNTGDGSHASLCFAYFYLPCAGVTIDIALKPRTTYYARVEATGEDGERAVSETASFDTGKMDEPWTASWIGMQEGDEFHPISEKSFTLEKAPARARLYITGVGLYEASLNGGKIGDDVPAPFFNGYNTKAMHLLEAGINIFYIKDFLGHEDISTTEVYTKASIETQRRALEKHSLVMSPATPSWVTKNTLEWLKSLGK